MKVIVGFRTAVTYRAEVTMTEAQFAEWNRRIDAGDRNVNDDLFEACEFEPADPADWGDFELDDFYAAKPRT